MTSNVVSKSVSELVTRSSANTGDRLVILSDPTGNTRTVTISASDFLSTVNSAIKTSQLTITSNTTPANSASVSNSVPVGSLWSDGSYLYVVTAPGTVKRSGALSLF